MDERMRMRSAHRLTVVVCLLTGALLCFASVYALEAGVDPDEITYADVAGRVVDDVTGEAVPGALVSLLYESVIADMDGKFSFKKVPTVHSSIISLQVSTETGVIIGCTSFDIPVKYYPLSAADGDGVDVVVIEPGRDEFVELRLKHRDIAGIDDYCFGCHELNPCAETATFGEVAGKKDKKLRGIVVKESELEKVREELMQLGLKKETYRKIRFDDTHPNSMNMLAKATEVGPDAGLFQVPPELSLYEYVENKVEYKEVRCDTCHSRHVPTDNRQYILMPFEDESELCYQCHK
ncbi:MAG: hypothetical protein C0609_06900 [Deltaproteobacteria bacterium]|nr:MAG: hypothetical protein C0609_06900 [Deltaproteobacteria bacterium]